MKRLERSLHRFAVLEGLGAARGPRAADQARAWSVTALPEFPSPADVNGLRQNDQFNHGGGRTA